MPKTRAELNWQPGFSLSRKPTKRAIVRRRPLVASGLSNKHRKITFVEEHPERCHWNQRSNSCAPSPSAAGSQVTTTQDITASDPDKTPTSDIDSNSGSARVERAGHADVRLGAESIICSKPRGDGLPQSVLQPPAHEGEFLNLQQPERWSLLNPVTSTTVSHSERLWTTPTLTALSMPINNVQFNTLSHRLQPILTRYDKEFCKIPLTADFSLNPFRCGSDPLVQPSFLVHAVMALAGHHVGSSATQDHCQAALQLLRQKLDAETIRMEGSSMLDAIILLFSLQETQSALGQWRIHLSGAYTILEALGGVKSWTTSARTVVQVAMFSWWDVIISLLARERAVIPVSYPQAILSMHNLGQWDYFRLCGCPSELVQIVLQLAHLSAERKPSSRSLSTSDVVSVTELESALNSWEHEPLDTSSPDEEWVQRNQDAMHCAEAWRHGLLLYIYRVFWWKPGTLIPVSQIHRARVVMDHVFASREEEMVSRQALLPLFFAGCEVKDRSSRDKIIRFCTLWDEKTRYHLFRSGITLLEEVWAEQEATGFENVWWGQVVDKIHLRNSSGVVQMRLCFG